MQIKQMWSRYWVEIVLVLAVFLGLGLGLRQMGGEVVVEEVDNPVGEQVVVMVGDVEVAVEVRDTEEGRALGLSGRMNLGENEGMLFVFEEVKVQTFWMKEMNFDLDMIWIKDGVVVDVNENVPAPTESNPMITKVAPSGPVDMVLEVNSGWVRENEVKVGDEVVIKSVEE